MLAYQPLAAVHICPSLSHPLLPPDGCTQEAAAAQDVDGSIRMATEAASAALQASTTADVARAKAGAQEAAAIHIQQRVAATRNAAERSTSTISAATADTKATPAAATAAPTTAATAAATAAATTDATTAATTAAAAPAAAPAAASSAGSATALALAAEPSAVAASEEDGASSAQGVPSAGSRWRQARSRASILTFLRDMGHAASRAREAAEMAASAAAAAAVVAVEDECSKAVQAQKKAVEAKVAAAEGASTVFAMAEQAADEETRVLVALRSTEAEANVRPFSDQNVEMTAALARAAASAAATASTAASGAAVKLSTLGEVANEAKKASEEAASAMQRAVEGVPKAVRDPMLEGAAGEVARRGEATAEAAAEEAGQAAARALNTANGVTSLLAGLERAAAAAGVAAWRTRVMADEAATIARETAETGIRRMYGDRGIAAGMRMHFYVQRHRKRKKRAREIVEFAAASAQRIVRDAEITNESLAATSRIVREAEVLALAHRTTKAVVLEAMTANMTKVRMCMCVHMHA